MEKTASIRSRQSKDAKEKYARTHKRNLSYSQVNVAADEALQEGCKSRQDLVNELCAGRIHHLKKGIVTISSGIHFRSVGELLARQRGHVGFMQRRRCFHVAQASWSMNFIHKATDSMCKC